MGLLESEPGSITRRAPFANNPVVGARGQQAQQRILEAALQVFAEVGYHRCGVKRITELAGCSRASFYQYFSSKEDLFRHLSGHVARELRASSEAIPALTPDREGLEALRAWFERYAAIYDAFRPVFVTFHAAASADDEVASGSTRVFHRQEAVLASKVVGADLAGAELTDVFRTMLEAVARSNRVRELVELAHPGTPLSRSRLDSAMADVFHRALFGIDPAVNSTRSVPEAAPAAPAAPAVPAADVPDDDDGLGPVGLQTRAAVLEAGHRVFVERGYYGTRVDDIASAAGVSHGVFYRYFENKNHLFRLLAARAARRLRRAYDAIEDIDPAEVDEVRAWLERYVATHAQEAAILRVWVDAIQRDPKLGAESVDAITTSRVRLAALLAGRGFGDVEAEAVVLIVLLETMVAGSASVDRQRRVARFIERNVVCVEARAAARPRRRLRRRGD